MSGDLCSIDLIERYEFLYKKTLKSLTLIKSKNIKSLTHYLHSLFHLNERAYVIYTNRYMDTDINSGFFIGTLIFINPEFIICIHSDSI